MQDWDDTYHRVGEVQTWVEGIVTDSIKLLNERKVHKVLDLCFGTGRHSIFLAEKGFEVYGIDISEKGKEIAEKKAREKGLKNIHLCLADMHSLPYEDGFFDAALAVYSLEHNTSAGLKQTISELWRVLKPRGLLVATLLSTRDPRYGTAKQLEPNTFVGWKDNVAETDVIHHFCDEKEAKELFRAFRFIMFKEYETISRRRKIKMFCWHFFAEKQ